MSVKIKDNTTRIILDTQRSASLAIRYMLDDIHQIANPKTPRKFGNLRGNVRKAVIGLKGTITWGQNYAIYQEYKRFVNYSTGGTGPHFAENSVEAVMRNPQSAMKKARLI